MSKTDKSAGPVPNIRNDWHCGFVGQSGRGKTISMKTYINQMNIHNDSAILCFDPDQEHKKESFNSYLQRIGYETRVFEPRSPDIVPDIMSCIRHPDDIDVVTNALVSGTSKDNSEFAPGAQTVLNGGIKLLYDRLDEHVTNMMIYDFFSRDPDEIYEEMAAGGFAQFAGPIKDSESGQSPHMTVINAAMEKGLRGELKRQNGGFDLSSWVKNPGKKALVIRTGEDNIIGAGPALRLIIDLVMSEAMRLPDSGCMLIADEIDTLPGSSTIPNIAARGRSEGCFVVLGVQTVKQIEDNFGEAPAWQILNNLGNYLMFNPGIETETRRMLKRLLGEKREVEFRSNQSRSSRRALEKDRHTAGTSESLEERCPLSDHQISRMETGDCVIVDFDGSWWFVDLTLPEWAD